QAKPDGTACNDGNACTQGGVCAGGVCAGTPVVCTASDQCHTASCNPTRGEGAGQAKPDGTACSDGNGSTEDDVCTNGVCAGTPVVCTGGDQCHVAGTCNPSTGACSNPTPIADGTACSDGNACTQNDVCTGGVCAGTAVAQCTACDDGNACT